MAQTVIGIFEKTQNAEEAVDRLLNDGFLQENIDIADHTDREGYSQEDRDRHNDSIGGFFSSLFGDSDDTHHHTKVAQSGVVVTVHAQDRDEAARAADILDDHGTVNVNEHAGTERIVNTDERLVDEDAVDRDLNVTAGADDQRIDVVEEELQVGKRDVQTGGVRVRSRIVERPVEETLRLRTEHVQVNRTPVDRPATEADLSQLKDSEIEVTEHAESAVASKKARVVEEINISKDVEEREEVIHDTVRHTEVDVDEIASDQRALLDDDEPLTNERRSTEEGTQRTDV